MRNPSPLRSRLLQGAFASVLASAALWVLMMVRAFQSLPHSVRLAVVCAQQLAAWYVVVALLWWFVWGAGSKARTP